MYFSIYIYIYLNLSISICIYPSIYSIIYLYYNLSIYLVSIYLWYNQSIYLIYLQYNLYLSVTIQFLKNRYALFRIFAFIRIHQASVLRLDAETLLAIPIYIYLYISIYIYLCLSMSIQIERENKSLIREIERLKQTVEVKDLSLDNSSAKLTQTERELEKVRKETESSKSNEIKLQVSFYVVKYFCVFLLNIWNWIL